MTDEAPIGWAIALPNDRKVKLFPDGAEFHLEFVSGERVTCLRLSRAAMDAVVLLYLQAGGPVA